MGIWKNRQKTGENWRGEGKSRNFVAVWNLSTLTSCSQEGQVYRPQEEYNGIRGGKEKGRQWLSSWNSAILRETKMAVMLPPAEEKAEKRHDFVSLDHKGSV